MDYEWDIGKAAENRRKHGVDFEAAVSALEDPNRLEEFDDATPAREDRFKVIGMANGRILFIVITYRGTATCRIISVRKATRHEQDQYYAGENEAR